MGRLFAYLLAYLCVRGGWQMDKRSPAICVWKPLPSAVLCGSFLIGCVVGCSLVLHLHSDMAIQLKEYLSDYFRIVRETEYKPLISGMFWDQIRWLLPCILLGTGFFGSIVLPVLFLARGVFFAFGVASFVRFYGLSGVILSGIVFGISALIWMPGLFLAGIMNFETSRSLLRGKRSDSIPISENGLRRSSVVLFGFGLILLSVLVERYISPALLCVGVRILG